MAAYVIVNVDVTDPAGYEEYRKHTLASLEGFGGKFIVRGGAAEIWEGDWQPKRVVVIEFENSEGARAWYNSPRYEELKAIRQRTANSQMILVEGV